MTLTRPPSTPAVAALTETLGTRVVTDPDASASWSRDQSPIADVGVPLAVVRAASTDDVVATLRIATEHGVPVVTRGAGSGLAGGANASDGCILLSVAGMDRIVDIDPARRTATVQPGVLNADLGRAAAEHGLRYTPDPGSREISSIGGNIATNAGGMSCCKYGVTADHVAALTAVLVDGTIVRTGAATRKNVTGLDLTSLLIGSEGTLAVVVEATVWLTPVAERESTLVAMFPSIDAAVQSVVATTARTTPSAMELMDRTTIGAVNTMTGMGIDEAAEAVVLVTCDGPAAAEEAAVCEEVASAHGATEVFRTDDRAEGAELMNARRMALPALEKLGSILLDDVGVPVGLLPDMVAAIGEVSARHDVVVGTFGHAADGNLHPTIIYDPADDDARERARAAFADIVRAAVDLGGTVSGEHGIGSLKLPFVGQMYGEAEIALMRRVKAAFDPAGLMNPGRGY